MANKQLVKAVAYLRTSSQTNVGADKDSDKHQLAAITGYAKAAGFEVVDTYYDAAVSGSDAITDRPGFAEMLARLLSNGVRTIIVESPDRFARDLLVQITGHDLLQRQGITLIPATAPTHFTESTPTAELVRNVLGAVAQFEKANLVAKLAAARKRKRAETGKCGGRESYTERDAEMVAMAKKLRRYAAAGTGKRRSLREIAIELEQAGYKAAGGKRFAPTAIKRMIEAPAKAA
jgi:DNA invertase Pin-like site-specific DNA recombinase